MSFHPRLFPWLQPPNPVPPQERASLVSAQSRGPRFGPFIGHVHVYQPQPFPGAPAFAYEGLGLVEYSPIGWSVANRGYLNPLPPPPLFGGQSLSVQGLGGVVRGQWIHQPLIFEAAQRSEDLGLGLPGM